MIAVNQFIFFYKIKPVIGQIGDDIQDVKTECFNFRPFIGFGVAVYIAVGYESDDLVLQVRGHRDVFIHVTCCILVIYPCYDVLVGKDIRINGDSLFILSDDQVT